MPLGVGQVARAALGRSRRGLFGGKRRLSGNKVSEDGDNKYAWLMLSIYSGCDAHTMQITYWLCCRSRRCWNPNVQKSTLYSSTLNRNVQLKVTAYALRSGRLIAAWLTSWKCNFKLYHVSDISCCYLLSAGALTKQEVWTGTCSNLQTKS